MKTLFAPALVLFFSAMFAGPAWCQTDSGPSAGSTVAEVKAHAITGEHAGQEVDLAGRVGTRPAVYVFVPAETWDRPVARFLKTLDTAISKDRPDVQLVAIWLTSDIAKSKAYLPKAQESLKFAHTTLAVFSGEAAGPNNWAINARAHVTLVVAEGGKVSASLGYISVNETDVPEVLKKLPAKK